jgi:RecB family exonuclease
MALLNGATAGEPITVAGADRVLRAVLGAAAEAHRTGTDEVAVDHPGLRPNPWNGLVSDPEVLDRMASRFGVDRTWSASQLEAYGSCPFVFFVERVLGIRRQGEADEETTPLTFGGVAHDALERFYGEILNDRRTALDDQTSALLLRSIESVVSDREAAGEWMGDPVLWENTKQQIQETLHEYVEWELEYLAENGEWPVAVELAFGFDKESPVELEGLDLSGEPARLRLRGKIDRVDQAGSGDDVQHRVLDYKSGSTPPAGGYKDGSVLQAPLYLEAIRSLGYHPDEGRYRKLKSPGKPKNGTKVKAGSAVHEETLAHAFSIVSRIRRGAFEPVMAPSQAWKNWHPGVEITRSRAKLANGRDRFDE